VVSQGSLSTLDVAHMQHEAHGSSSVASVTPIALHVLPLRSTTEVARALAPSTSPRGPSADHHSFDAKTLESPRLADLKDAGVPDNDGSQSDDTDSGSDSASESGSDEEEALESSFYRLHKQLAPSRRSRSVSSVTRCPVLPLLTVCASTI